MKEPKIRFNGFQGEWDTSPLSQIATMHARIGWQNLRKDEFLSKGDYYLITGTDFVDGIIDYQTCHYVTEDRYNQDKNIQLKEGSILITKDGTLGKVAYVESLDKPATLNAGVFNVVCKKGNTDSRFLFQYLKSPRLMNHVNSTATGGTIKHLNQNILVNFPICLPEKKEQEFIASYFQHLDSLIQLTTKKIESLKQVKAASLQSMFPQEGETTPRVRFKGFEGEWEETPFSETFDYLKNNSLSRAELSDGGVVMNIHYGDVLIKYGECVDVGKEVKTFVKEEQVAKRLHQSCAITNGDIIFADAAEDNTVGKCSEIIAKEDDAIISGLHTIPCRPMKQYATRYLGYYLNSNAYHNQLLPHIQGTKISSISKKAISQTHINSPLDIAEQRAIASYFTNLDRQITLQSQRLEKLKQIKAACLDKMFV